MMIEASHSEEKSFLRTLLEIGAIWISLVTGYYILFGGGYAAQPIQITLYYMFWLVLTLFSFQHLYRSRRLIENAGGTYALLLAGSVSVALYLGYLLPSVPVLTWTQPWQPPSELLYATPWYFLPKSIEVLIQQLLVAALVLLFSSHGYSMRATSWWCAGLFGGAHILLLLGGKGELYTAVFTALAIVASFIFTYLILKVKDGLIYSYFLHWLFYAVIIIFLRNL